MRSERPAFSEVAYRRHRLVVYEQLLVGVTFSCILSEFLIFQFWYDPKDLTTAWRVFMGVFLALAILATVVGIRELVNGTVFLSADDQGIWERPYEAGRSPYLIPWSAILELKLCVGQSSESDYHYLEVRMDPDGWQPPEWIYDPSQVHVTLEALEAQPDLIYLELRRRWQMTLATPR